MRTRVRYVCGISRMLGREGKIGKAWEAIFLGQYARMMTRSGFSSVTGDLSERDPRMPLGSSHLAGKLYQRIICDDVTTYLYIVHVAHVAKHL